MSSLESGHDASIMAEGGAGDCMLAKFRGEGAFPTSPRVADLPPKEQACVAALEEYVRDLPLSELNRALFNDPRTLRRFAVARRGDTDGAKKQIQKCCAWRDKHLSLPISALTCPDCEKDVRNHCFFSLGPDHLGRNVVYACARRALINEAHGASQHMARTLEIGFARPGAASTWVWIVDFNGFGVHDAMQFTTSATVLSVFQDVYPECMGSVVFINPPSVLSILVSAVKKLLDERTMGKITSVKIKGGDLEGARACPHLSTLSEDQKEWLSKALAMKPTAGNLPPTTKLHNKGLNFDAIPVQQE
mmetsp:Transcript_42480/g.104124  ORF Transcript_42480/g.104124 Transcript_42480/m.104124 type:complete len:305 (-) Transcript_42480:114-1028(-)